MSSDGQRCPNQWTNVQTGSIWCSKMLGHLFSWIHLPRIWVLEKQLGLQQQPYRERVHSCSQLNIQPLYRIVRRRSWYCEWGNCKLDFLWLPAHCTRTQSLQERTSRSFLGVADLRVASALAPRWQVASPDLSPQNRAQPVFEVQGDWACHCKCSINLAIYREGNEGNAGDSGKVF